jgi:hypothetical protein
MSDSQLATMLEIRLDNAFSGFCCFIQWCETEEEVMTTLENDRPMQIAG